jgi:orotate phosphoribosyltransferase
MATAAEASGERVLRSLRETGACHEGHFQLSSGLHSDRYFQCALALARPPVAESLAREIAALWRGESIETVVGPALGGIVIAYELARQLGARALFTEREGGEMRFRRGFSVRPGERVLLCEDVVTTGKSVGEALEVLRQAQATPLGISAILRRVSDPSRDEAILFGLPVRAPLRVETREWEATSCPLCRDGVPVAKPGSRGIREPEPTA